jgi:hypothetical protein
VVEVGLIVLEHLPSVLVRARTESVSRQVDEDGRRTIAYEEVSEEEAESAASSPDEEDLDTEVGSLGSVDTVRGLVDEVRGSVTDGKVPEPVGGDGERHGLSSDGEREDLSGDDPSDRSPSGGESGDVDADEGDEDSLGGKVDGSCGDAARVSDSHTHDGNEELTDHHDCQAKEGCQLTLRTKEVEAR